MTRLVDCDPHWVMEATGPWEPRDDVDITTAQGIWFDSPSGTPCVAWFRDHGVSDDTLPRGGRWVVSGTDFSDLTLHPSIDMSCGGKYPQEWHGWVKNGEVT